MSGSQAENTRAVVGRGCHRPFRGRLGIDELSRVLDGQRSGSDGEIIGKSALAGGKMAGSFRLPA